MTKSADGWRADDPPVRDRPIEEGSRRGPKPSSHGFAASSPPSTPPPHVAAMTWNRFPHDLSSPSRLVPQLCWIVGFSERNRADAWLAGAARNRQLPDAPSRRVDVSHADGPSGAHASCRNARATPVFPPRRALSPRRIAAGGHDTRRAAVSFSTCRALRHAPDAWAARSEPKCTVPSRERAGTPHDLRRRRDASVLAPSAA